MDNKWDSFHSAMLREAEIIVDIAVWDHLWRIVDPEARDPSEQTIRFQPELDVMVRSLEDLLI